MRRYGQHLRLFFCTNARKPTEHHKRHKHHQHKHHQHTSTHTHALQTGALLIRVDATGPGSGMDQDAFGMILIVILIAGPILVSIMGFQEVRGTEHRPRSPDLDTHD